MKTPVLSGRRVARPLLLTALALVICAGLLTTARAQQSLTTYNLTLKADQVSRGDDGRIVIAATVQGDLKGALTLTVTSVAPDGSIGGEWALVNTYLQDQFGAGHSATDGDDDDVPGHLLGSRLIQNGTISGAITGGTLTFGADGQPASLGSVQLSITYGSLTFQNINKSGTATLALIGLQTPATSSGSAAFSF